MKEKIKIDLKLPEKIFGLDRSFLALFLLPMGLLLLFLLSLRLILIPKIAEIKNVNLKIKTVTDNTSKINEQNKYLSSMNQEELQKNADYLNDAVLKDKKSYLLLGVIRSVANKFDYQIESFSLSPGEIKSDIKTNELSDTTQLPLEVSMSGPKDKNLDLILALEKTLPILFIDKFEKRVSGDSVSMNLTVHSYYISGDINIDTKSITLSELTLSKEESALVEKISSFTKIENNQFDVGTSEFQQYSRANPFSL